MKKFLTLFIALILSFNIAQSQCELANGSFEEFLDVSEFIEYDFDIELDEPVYIADQWFPLIRFLLIAFSDFFSILSGEDLTNFITNSYGQDIYEPGAEGTARALKLSPGQFITLADAYTATACGDRPEALNGYYRHVGSSLDSLSIITILSDTLYTLDLSQDIDDLAPLIDGYAVNQIAGGDDVYTSFQMPIIYTSEDTPDSALIYVISVVDSTSIANGNEAYHVIDEFSFGMISSTNDLNRPELIDVFPNPAQEVINVESEETPIEGVKIYNAFGQLMYTSSSKTYKETISTNHFSPGIYYIDANMGEFVSRKKFLKTE